MMTSAHHAPITVVGAGPAGLSCAIALARAGRDVVVLEWHATVGSRFHDDFQGMENWSDATDTLEELDAAGIEASFDRHPVSEATIFDARGAAYEVNATRPLFYLVRRGRSEGSLDRALFDQAIAAGAEVRLGDRARSTSGPTVLATGPRTADAIAAGYIFETDLPDGAWVAFDDRLAPLGYAYLLIHAGRGTVASCMFTGFKRQAEHVARSVDFFRDRVGLTLRDARPFGGYANFRLPRRAMQGGHPVIGEQAGFQDALAGFGMRLALRSGVLAARSIIESSDYADLWRRALLPSLRTGVANRFIFNSLGDLGRSWAIRGLCRRDITAKLRRLYSPSWATWLTYPVARLRYRAALRDPSCDHINCECVWCTHGATGSEQGCANGMSGFGQ